MTHTLSEATYEQDLNFVLTHTIHGMSAEEVETVMLNSKTEPYLTIETTDNAELTRLKRLLRGNPKEWRLVDYTVAANDRERLTSVTVRCPKSLLTLRSGTRTQNLSPEEKAKRLENMKKARAAQLANTTQSAER